MTVASVLAGPHLVQGPVDLASGLLHKLRGQRPGAVVLALDHSCLAFSVDGLLEDLAQGKPSTQRAGVMTLSHDARAISIRSHMLPEVRGLTFCGFRTFWSRVAHCEKEMKSKYAASDRSPCRFQRVRAWHEGAVTRELADGDVSASHRLHDAEPGHTAKGLATRWRGKATGSGLLLNGLSNKLRSSSADARSAPPTKPASSGGPAPTAAASERRAVRLPLVPPAGAAQPPSQAPRPARSGSIAARGPARRARRDGAQGAATTAATRGAEGAANADDTTVPGLALLALVVVVVVVVNIIIIVAALRSTRAALREVVARSRAAAPGPCRAGALCRRASARTPRAAPKKKECQRRGPGPR
eukprot:scaffold503_cov365-Prasinococcus_capsulatus_cf.AAC.1